MAETGSGRDPRSSGGFTVHIADELEVYFNEYVRGSPVGFISTPKWRPPTDIYETDEQFVVAMDIAGVAPDGFTVTFDAGILSVSGERREQASGRREYHAMEVKVGPFERRFRFPRRVDPASLKATYEWASSRSASPRCPSGRSRSAWTWRRGDGAAPRGPLPPATDAAPRPAARPGRRLPARGGAAARRDRAHHRGGGPRRGVAHEAVLLGVVRLADGSDQPPGVLDDVPLRRCCTRSAPSASWCGSSSSATATCGCWCRAPPG